jgi:hypothetical protein
MAFIAMFKKVGIYAQHIHTLGGNQAVTGYPITVSQRRYEITN